MVQGASYTDVNAQLPALTFLTIVAVICAVLFFVNARYRVWSLPIIAVGLLLLVSILLGTAYPAFIQQFRVNPNEQQYEKPFIERNIAGTRRAFGLDADPPARSGPSRVDRDSADDMQANEATIAQHPAVAPLRPEGELRVRAADPAVLRLRRRGRGPVRDRRRATRPDGVRPRGEPERHQRSRRDLAERAPRLHARVRDRRRPGELDHGRRRTRCSRSRTSRPRGSRRPSSRGSTTGRSTTCDFVVVNSSDGRARLRGSIGRDAVHLRRGGRRRARRVLPPSPLRVALPGREPADLRPARQRQPHPDRPDIAQRAEETMPFLTFDARPLPGRDRRGVRLDHGRVHDVGRLSLLPGGQPGRGRPPELLPRQEVNYIRNSVKAVVDAYDGSGHVLRRPR